MPMLAEGGTGDPAPTPPVNTSRKRSEREEEGGREQKGAEELKGGGGGGRAGQEKCVDRVTSLLREGACFSTPGSSATVL